MFKVARTRRQKGDADRGYDYRLKIVCPKCGAIGTFVSSRPNGIYFCIHCEYQCDWEL